MTDEQLRRWAALRDDAARFIPRLTIQDYHNKTRPIGALLPEQEPWFDALLHHKRVIGIKPRQVGWSTITNAFLFWKAYTSRHSRLVLSMVHEDRSLQRFKQMLRVYWKGMPPELRAALAKDNDEVTEFGHNGSAFHRLLAGGSGQARSYTFNDLYATEMSKWKTRTSANSSAERTSTQDETWGSAMATIHDPDSHIIVESTGAGPFGLFYDLYKKSLDPKSSWHLVFVPWYDVARYQLPLSPVEARDLEQELDPEEVALMRDFGVALPQLAWRRRKMFDDMLSASLFRREYPGHHSEPFLADARMWFDHAALAVQGKYAKSLAATEKIFHQPERGSRYVISADTSGGTGGDEASVKVLREDSVEVASWDTNQVDPGGQALQIGRFSQLYGQGSRPHVIIEANRYGKDVIDRCDSMGLNLYKTSSGDDLWTTGKAAGNTKRRMYVHAREVINAHACVVTDAPTVSQLQTIVEKGDGRIEAPGDSKGNPPIGHDDRADAYVIGLWGLRELGWRLDTDGPDRERERARQLVRNPTKELGLA